MKQMYMSPERRPDYLPPFATTVAIPATSTLPSSVTGAPSNCEPPTKRPRKQNSCSTPGCDGSGHKNHAHWADGHTTRAGCPLVTASHSQISFTSFILSLCLHHSVCIVCMYLIAHVVCKQEVAEMSNIQTGSNVCYHTSAVSSTSTSMHLLEVCIAAKIILTELE